MKIFPSLTVSTCVKCVLIEVSHIKNIYIGLNQINNQIEIVCSKILNFIDKKPAVVILKSFKNFAGCIGFPYEFCSSVCINVAFGRHIVLLFIFFKQTDACAIWWAMPCIGIVSKAVLWRK